MSTRVVFFNIFSDIIFVLNDIENKLIIEQEGKKRESGMTRNV